MADDVSCTAVPAPAVPASAKPQLPPVDTDFSSSLFIPNETGQRVKCQIAIKLASDDQQPRFQRWAEEQILASAVAAEPSLANVDADRIISKIFSNLKIADFAESSILKAKRLQAQSVLASASPDAPIALELEVRGRTVYDQMTLAYLRGLLGRKGDCAIVPLPNTRYQLLVFFEDKKPVPASTRRRRASVCFAGSPCRSRHSSKSSIVSDSLDTIDDSQQDEDMVSESPQEEEFEGACGEDDEDLLLADEDSSERVFLGTTMRALLCERFNFVFDLDETLIRAAPLPSFESSSSASKSGPNLPLFRILQVMYTCQVFEGVPQALEWACEIFNVHVFTNAIYEYARQVLMILDPKRKHLLRNVDPTDEAQLRRFLRTREQMTPSLARFPTKQGGMKDLEKHGLELLDSVVLDDDVTVWVVPNRRTLVPFSKVKDQPQSIKIDFHRLRTETWVKIKELQKL